MHILLIRFSSLGDVVLQTSVIKWLREIWGPELTLTFVTSSEFLPLIQNHPELNNVVAFDRKNKEKWSSLNDKIKDVSSSKPIDLILDLHGTLRSLRLRLSFWKIPALTMDKRRLERFILVKIKSPRIKKFLGQKIFKNRPQIMRLINDIEGIFLKNKISVLKPYPNADHSFNDFFIQHQRETFLLKPSLPLSHQHSFSFEPYIVIAPSASFSSKRWPIQSFLKLVQDLLEKTTFHIVVLAGKEDRFCSTFDNIDSSRLSNLQGKTSLQETMFILSNSVLCIGNDSGLNHIAEAYNVPVLTLFGSTSPYFGFRPYRSQSFYLWSQLSCSPCSTTGRKDCSQKSHLCMESLTTHYVLEVALSMLSKAQNNVEIKRTLL